MKTIGDGLPAVNSKGKIDVFVNDQTNPLFQYLLIDELKDDITLTSDIVKDDEVINVSSGHGFVGSGLASGEIMTIWENNRYSQVRVKSVSTDAITIEYPMAFPFTVSGAKIIRGSSNLNIDGSSLEVDFLMKIQDFTIPIDISKVILTMFHSGAGDDSKFAGITALTNGLWFRKENDIDFNLGNYINNQDFKLRGAYVDYPSKGPGGTESTDVVFDLEEIFGQVMRMDSEKNDVFRCQVRDNLIGLTSFKVSMIGSYTDEG